MPKGLIRPSGGRPDKRTICRVSKHKIEFDVPGAGPTSSLVLRTSDVPTSAIVMTEFLAKHPNLADKSRRSKFEQRLPGIMSAMYGGPRPWKQIAKSYGRSSKSTFDSYMRRLRGRRRPR